MASQSTDPNAKTNWGGTVVPQAVKTQSILLSMNDLLSRKWYPIIVYQLVVNDAMGFSDLEEAIGDVSSKMLSESLKQLEEDHGIVERTVRSDRPLRVDYELTERGEAFGRVVLAMQEWGEQHLESPE
jgi:DNA-binding HxlR family transcriptional regulator